MLRLGAELAEPRRGRDSARPLPRSSASPHRPVSALHPAHPPYPPARHSPTRRAWVAPRPAGQPVLDGQGRRREQQQPARRRRRWPAGSACSGTVTGMPVNAARSTAGPTSGTRASAHAVPPTAAARIAGRVSTADDAPRLGRPQAHGGQPGQRQLPGPGAEHQREQQDQQAERRRPRRRPGRSVTNPPCGSGAPEMAASDARAQRDLGAGYGAPGRAAQRRRVQPRADQRDHGRAGGRRPQGPPGQHRELAAGGRRPRRRPPCPPPGSAAGGRATYRPLRGPRMARAAGEMSAGTGPGGSAAAAGGRGAGQRRGRERRAWAWRRSAPRTAPGRR